MKFFDRLFRSPGRDAETERAKRARFEEFRVQAREQGFSVEVDAENSRILHYTDAEGLLLFTVDIPLGVRGIVLEWSGSPEAWTSGGRERLAFERTKQFLEALGFEVKMSPPA